VSAGFQQQTGEPPTFGIDEDGQHIWWSHDCQVDWFGDNSDVTLMRTEPQSLPINTTGWTVQSINPLTVTPSILCTGCHTHGFITDGKWVTA
jgi:hypothetical protein